MTHDFQTLNDVTADHDVNNVGLLESSTAQLSESSHAETGQVGGGFDKGETIDRENDHPITSTATLIPAVAATTVTTAATVGDLAATSATPRSQVQSNNLGTNKCLCRRVVGDMHPVCHKCKIKSEQPVCLRYHPCHLCRDADSLFWRRYMRSYNEFRRHVLSDEQRQAHDRLMRDAGKIAISSVFSPRSRGFAEPSAGGSRCSSRLRASADPSRHGSRCSPRLRAFAEPSGGGSRCSSNVVLLDTIRAQETCDGTVTTRALPPARKRPSDVADDCASVHDSLPKGRRISANDVRSKPRIDRNASSERLNETDHFEQDSDDIVHVSLRLEEPNASGSGGQTYRCEPQYSEPAQPQSQPSASGKCSSAVDDVSLLDDDRYDTATPAYEYGTDTPYSPPPSDSELDDDGGPCSDAVGIVASASSTAVPVEGTSEHVISGVHGSAASSTDCSSRANDAVISSVPADTAFDDEIKVKDCNDDVIITGMVPGPSGLVAPLQRHGGARSVDAAGRRSSAAHPVPVALSAVDSGGGLLAACSQLNRRTSASVVAGVAPSQQKTTNVLPSQQRATNGTPGQERATNAAPSQQRTTNVTAGQKRATTIAPSQQRVTNVTSRQQRATNVTPGQQRSTNVTAGQQRETNVAPRQQMVTNVVFNQQRATHVTPRQQRATNWTQGQQRATNVLPNQQRATNVTLGQQRATKVVPSKQRATNVVSSQQRAAANVANREQRATNVAPTQQKANHVTPSQQRATNVALSRHRASNVAPRQQRVLPSQQGAGQQVVAPPQSMLLSPDERAIILQLRAIKPNHRH